MLGLASTFHWPGISTQAPRLTIPPSIRTHVSNTIIGIVILSLLTSMYRWPSIVVQPHRPGPRMIRAGIWTVHFGIDDEGRDSQRRMRDVVRFVITLRLGDVCWVDGVDWLVCRDMELDVLGLLETELHVSDITMNALPGTNFTSFIATRVWQS